MSIRKGSAQKLETYVVTEDLSVLVPRWCRNKRPGTIVSAEDPFFQETLEKLKKILEKAFAKRPVEVVTLPRTAFDDLLHKRRKEEFWISLDDVYPEADPDEVSELSITRYVNSDRDELDYGRRPEKNLTDPKEETSLREQVRSCANKIDALERLRDRKLTSVLVDDGTFEGGTITKVLDHFADQGRYITSVKLGVAKEKGVLKISRWSRLDDKGVQHKVPFIGASKLCPPLHDWVCERDFFPGVLYGGKVVGKGEGDKMEPLRVGRKMIPVRMQYIEGWGNPSWASITGEVVAPFTLAILELTIEVWTRIETWLQVPNSIVIGDLPAVPHKCLYTDDLEAMLEWPWISYLKSERDKLLRGRL